MTVYIGVDFHARKQTLSYLTTEDGEIKQTELQHNLEEVRGFYAELRKVGHVIVGFESSGYAAWFEELLEELGCEIWIGHATVIRKCARRRQKNDRRDADLILELKWRGDLTRSSLSPNSTGLLIHQSSGTRLECICDWPFPSRSTSMRKCCSWTKY